MKGMRIFGAAIFTAVLTACAATGPDMPGWGKMLGETTGQKGRACVRSGDIRGYGVLEGNVVSIDGGNRYYLATFLPGCNDLETSARALFSGSFGQVCGQTMDKVVTGNDRCVINHMYEFKNRKEAFATYNGIREERKALKGK